MCLSAFPLSTFCLPLSPLPSLPPRQKTLTTAITISFPPSSTPRHTAAAGATSSSNDVASSGGGGGGESGGGGGGFDLLTLAFGSDTGRSNGSSIGSVGGSAGGGEASSNSHNHNYNNKEVASGPVRSWKEARRRMETAAGVSLARDLPKDNPTGA